MQTMNVPALLATYQLRQREYLLRITRAMTSRLDLPSVLKLILSSAAEMVGCRAGLIVLARTTVRIGDAVDEAARFQIRAVYNIPPQVWPAFEPLLDVASLLQTEDVAEDDDDVIDAPDKRRGRGSRRAEKPPRSAPTRHGDDELC